ncbi:hypothetical protein GCM10027185_47140 [Spirosoma pulveris]
MNPAGELKTYHDNLTALRKEHTHQRELPDLKFFLFGMGDRLKLIYRNGRLLNALTGNIEEQWSVKEEVIVPSAYLVHLVLADGQIVQIREDETGVWLLQPTKRPRLIPGTRSRLSLPRFADKRFGSVLRVLHQELLINIIDGRPVPNFLVYQKPWYRNAALMGMVLHETNNLPLIQDWIMAIRDPFDCNNRGIAEADNLGEVLFLVSLVSDKTHPVVQMALDSVSRFRKETHILGQTDSNEHPVYQTKWLKYGLKSLNLPDPYVIPEQYDSYSSLFWYAYTNEHVDGKKFDDASGINRPCLGWAEDHFYHEKRGILGNLDYPLSWEQKASDAHYPGMTVLDKDLVKQKLAFPHTRHAAEMFLLLYKQ